MINSLTVYKRMDGIADLSLLAAIKNLGYVGVYMASLKYLSVTPVSVTALAALIVLDVALGVLNSGVNRGWNSVRSRKLTRGIIAKCIVIVVPFSLAAAGKGIGIDVSTLAQSFINLLILSELYSVLGNIYGIKTGQQATEFDAVAYIVGQIRVALKKVIIDDSNMK